MKKLLSIILSTMLCLSFVGCSNNNTAVKSSSQQESSNQSKKDDIDDVSEIKKYIKQSDEKIDKYQKQISELERKIRNK